MFVHPMWDNESQRIGKQKCTPLGYTLHVIADLIGAIGLLILFVTGAYLAYRGVSGTFHKTLYWLLAIPFGFALVGQVLFQISWSLAYKRGFEYDYENREASWIEDGERRTYRWDSQWDSPDDLTGSDAE